VLKTFQQTRVVIKARKHKRAFAQEEKMVLSTKQIAEFQRIHKQVFCRPITKQQASLDGLALIRLVSIIQPMLLGEAEVNEEL
jgi:hypothetical protein